MGGRGNIKVASGGVKNQKFIEARNFARKEICGKMNVPSAKACKQRVDKRLGSLWHATNAARQASVFKSAIGGLAEGVSTSCWVYARKSNPRVHRSVLAKTSQYASCVKELLNDNLLWLNKEETRLGLHKSRWCVGPVIKLIGCYTKLRDFVAAFMKYRSTHK